MESQEQLESRLRGYLFVLQQSLRSFLPPDVVTDALREVESHVRERLAALPPAAVGHEELERVLTELGTPLQVARAYSAEMAVDQALVTERLAPIAQALWHVASTTVGGFFVASALMVGYAAGAGFILGSFIKPFAPEHASLLFTDLLRLGYFGLPLDFLLGAGLLVGTHRAARGILLWWRRRSGWRLRLVRVAPKQP